MFLLILNIKGTFNITMYHNNVPPILLCESNLTKSFSSIEIDPGSSGRDHLASSLVSLPWFAWHICSVIFSMANAVPRIKCCKMLILRTTVGYVLEMSPGHKSGIQI